MDGSVTPIQLRKKALHSDVAVCGFQGFLMSASLFIYLCSLVFFRTCVVCVAIALRTSVYGTFSGYSRWVACCMSLLPIMALPPYFLTPVFYV